MSDVKISVESNFEKALSFASDLIQIPSLSGREGEVAKRLWDEMETLGFEQLRVDEVGNVIGVIPGGGQAPPIMFNCHLDVVAEGDHSEWDYEPFGGLMSGGFLHGRGSMDIKGPLALQTYVAASMKGQSRGDLIVAHTVFEECGGWGMEHLMESKIVEPALVIIGEATDGDICIGHRGRAEVEITVTGLAGHASVPERAKNPIDLIPDIVAGIEEIKRDQKIDSILGASTVVATSLEVLPESRNVIPDRLTVVLDWRVLPEMNQGQMIQQVRDAITRQIGSNLEGFEVKVATAAETQCSYSGLQRERDSFTPGFLMDPNDPLVQVAASAVGKQGKEGPADVRPWAFATDGGWTKGVFGIPTLGFAPGKEHFAHTNTERLDIEDARWSFHKYPDLVLALQNYLSSSNIV